LSTARDEIRFRSPVDQAGYVQLSKVVLHDVTLTKEARFTYGLLLSYAWQDPETFVGHGTLAWDLQVTVRSVHRYLKELKEAGLIDIEQRRNGRGEWLSNTYWIEQLEDRYGQLTQARVAQVAARKAAAAAKRDLSPTGRTPVSDGDFRRTVGHQSHTDGRTPVADYKESRAVPKSSKSARAISADQKKTQTQRQRPAAAVVEEEPKLLTPPVSGTGTVDLEALERRLGALTDGFGGFLDPRAVAHAIDRETVVLARNGGMPPERHNPWAYASKIAREEHAKLKAGDDRKQRARDIQARVDSCDKCENGFVMIEQNGAEAAMKCPDCLGSATFGRLEGVK
jgi:DNA-binding transcriptional ArsR family regulator